MNRFDMYVARAKAAQFQITELVEEEQRVVARATKVPVVGAPFLGAVRLADTAVHVQHDGRLRPPRMHSVNPGPRQIGQCREVGLDGQPTGLEPAHLAGLIFRTDSARTHKKKLSHPGNPG